MGARALSTPGIDRSDADLPIPQEGLRNVLSAWSGRGDLLATLAASLDDDRHDRHWTAADVRRRAHRTLLQELTPALTRWPRTVHAWLDALPAQSIHRRERSPAAVAGIDWVSTRIRSGWPPAAFEVRSRERTPHTLLLSTLRWTLDRLTEVKEDSFRLEPTVVGAVMPQLGVGLTMLDEEPLSSVVGEQPSGEDLRAVAREGRPWNLVAAVASQLVAVATSPEEWAMRLIAPDPELRATLFHLGTLGTLLVAAEALGGSVSSSAPLTGVSSRPAYAVCDQHGIEWDVWFEAGGVWSRYRRSSAYVEATAGLTESPAPLRPDLMLVRPNEAALVLECKYSSRTETVGRVGLTQAMAYGVEARSRLAPRVEAYVVAPDGVISRPSKVATEVGLVGLVSPSRLKATLNSFWT
jgi:hypothetical protein